MSDTSRHERGYFWPAPLDYPETNFAPDNGVYGTLSISQEGDILLDLDGHLDSVARTDDYDTAPITIAGKLKADGNSTILYGARRNGRTFSSNSISHEKYVAAQCLISRSSVRSMLAWSDQVRRISSPFSGFEDWLMVRPIEITSDGESIDLRYSPPVEIETKLNDRSVKLKHDLEAPWYKKYNTTKANFIQKSSLEYYFERPVTVGDASIEHLRFHDLMILLTDREVPLEWPQIYGDGDENPASFYYRRTFKGDDEYEGHRSWTTFEDLRCNFGHVITNWVSKSADLGPALYLYTSTKRGRWQYFEQHFMSLMWGLEALHRKTSDCQSDPQVEERKTRILDVIEKADRGWLERRLKHAGELSLERRLATMIFSLELPLRRRQVNRFAVRCAAIRNNISHFGLIDRDRPSAEAYGEINLLIPALSILYHAIILRELGLEQSLIASIFLERTCSYRIQLYLARARLDLPEPGSKPSKRSLTALTDDQRAGIDMRDSARDPTV